jgi:hypothetical protein
MPGQGYRQAGQPGGVLPHRFRVADPGGVPDRISLLAAGSVAMSPPAS